MLTRAVRRRQNLRYARDAARQIQLPWLCPALWSSHTTAAAATPSHRPIAQRPKPERSQSAALLSTHSRKLASAAPIPDIIHSSTSFSQFPYNDQPSQQPYTLPPLAPDLSQILMIDHTTTDIPTFNEQGRKHTFIRGNACEVEATLDACLQIHRWDRAADVLHQLRITYQNDQTQLQRLYNKFLEAMVYDHIWNRSTENVARINRWVEKDMKDAGVEPNALTFALKIKVAMATLDGKKRNRTVQRYWDMAKKHNADWEVASLREILSDSDLGKLSEISPTTVEFEQAEPGPEEDSLEVQENVVSKPAIPGIRPTEQKGLGMWSLKKSLSVFDGSTNGIEDLENLEPATREAYTQQRQRQLEQDSLTSAMDRWKAEHEKRMKMGLSGNLSRGRIGAMTWEWHQLLAQSIRDELERVSDAESKKKPSEEEKQRIEYGPFLRLIEPDHLAALTVIAVFHQATMFGVYSTIKLSQLVTGLGRAVEQEVVAKLKNERSSQRKSKNSAVGSVDLVTEVGMGAVRPSRAEWSLAQTGKVGSILCELLFNVAKVNTKQVSSDGIRSTITAPVFERRSMYQNGKRLGVVVMNQEVGDMLMKEPVADLIAKQLPMVCKPTPWTGFQEGGYLESKVDVLRIKYHDQSQKQYTEAAAERGDLDQLFTGLNVLGQTGWRINPDVFNVMIEAWNTGEEIANLPPLDRVFPDIPKPAEDAPAKEKYQYYRAVQAIDNEKSGLHSNRCFQNFQMEVARALLNDTFYLPHNVDFRGRAYPIPPYLNQMGADNARGLLIFDQGRELGEKGFRWLKIHLANVCGYDKASLTDRAQFANDHIQDIYDSVNKPLSGKRWWLEAEDPWQCLATCYELVKAIDSGDPHTFVSHLPVHQDGSCNGLQHYAALGGDIAGAKQVNLEPSDKPADVYTGVCELVKAEIKQDAERGYELAKVLDGRVTRKIVKQTVMTNVYGVTFNGAMKQVRKQLVDYLPDLDETKNTTAASVYIAKKIFKGLGTLFEGAHDIQYWLGDCANRVTTSISRAQLNSVARYTAEIKGTTDKRIKKDVPLAARQTIEANDFRSTIVWTTPLKLPVVQPYRISKSNQIRTHMASISLAEPSITDSVDRRKQLQAFPPNFIHSLDATHMMLSAIKANEAGLTFSAVHDSFWTHAADVDTLNTLLREAFIRMHNEDIVGRLLAEFQKRYQGHLYLAQIRRGSPLAQRIQILRKSINLSDLKTTSVKKGKVNAADKRRKFHELMQEHKRQQLLASEDPKEQAKGKKMVTPASLFEQMQGEQHLISKNSLGETALAHVPETQQRADKSILEEAIRHGAESEVHDVDLGSTLDPLVIEAEGSTNGDGAMQSVPAIGHFLQARKVRKAPTSATPRARGRPRKDGADGEAEGKWGEVEESPVGLERNAMWLWLPLSFKPVPKKGDWDVQRLRESVYFFS